MNDLASEIASMRERGRIPAIAVAQEKLGKLAALYAVSTAIDGLARAEKARDFRPVYLDVLIDVIAELQRLVAATQQEGV